MKMVEIARQRMDNLFQQNMGEIYDRIDLECRVGNRHLVILIRDLPLFGFQYHEARKVAKTLKDEGFTVTESYDSDCNYIAVTW